MSTPLVSIVMGSDSDLEIMREAGKALEPFGIAYEMDVTSAIVPPTALRITLKKPPREESA